MGVHVESHARAGGAFAAKQKCRAGATSASGVGSISSDSAAARSASEYSAGLKSSGRGEETRASGEMPARSARSAACLAGPVIVDSSSSISQIRFSV